MSVGRGEGCLDVEVSSCVGSSNGETTSGRLELRRRVEGPCCNVGDVIGDVIGLGSRGVGRLKCSGVDGLLDNDLDLEVADRFTPDNWRFGGGGGGGLNLASSWGDIGTGGEEGVPLDRIEGGTKDSGRVAGIFSPAILRLMRHIATENASFVRRLSPFRSTRCLAK